MLRISRPPSHKGDRSVNRQPHLTSEQTASFDSGVATPDMEVSMNRFVVPIVGVLLLATNAQAADLITIGAGDHLSGQAVQNGLNDTARFGENPKAPESASTTAHSTHSAVH